MNGRKDVLSLLGADKSQGIEFGAAVGFSVFNVLLRASHCVSAESFARINAASSA